MVCTVAVAVAPCAGIVGEEFDPMFGVDHLPPIVRLSRLAVGPERALEK